MCRLHCPAWFRRVPFQAMRSFRPWTSATRSAWAQQVPAQHRTARPATGRAKSPLLWSSSYSAAPQCLCFPPEKRLHVTGTRQSPLRDTQGACLGMRSYAIPWHSCKAAHGLLRFPSEHSAQAEPETPAPRTMARRNQAGSAARQSSRAGSCGCPRMGPPQRYPHKRSDMRRPCHPGGVEAHNPTR